MHSVLGTISFTCSSITMLHVSYMHLRSNCFISYIVHNMYGKESETEEEKRAQITEAAKNTNIIEQRKADSI